MTGFTIDTELPGRPFAKIDPSVRDIPGVVHRLEHILHQFRLGIDSQFGWQIDVCGRHVGSPWLSAASLRLLALADRGCPKVAVERKRPTRGIAVCRAALFLGANRARKWERPG